MFIAKSWMVHLFARKRLSDCNVRLKSTFSCYIVLLEIIDISFGMGRLGGVTAFLLPSFLWIKCCTCKSSALSAE